MNFTILLTDKCNLKCTYCYENKKNRCTMSSKKVNEITRFIDRVLDYYGRKTDININIQGGEVLLEYKKLKGFVKMLSSKEYFKRITYISMTTNGTIYSEEISKFIRENKISLSISVDGNKEVHNKYRIFNNGEGSFDTVILNLKKYILDGIDIRCRMTYTSETVNKIFDGISELELIGVKTFVLAFNPFDKNWDVNHNKDLLNEYNKIKKKFANRNDLKISLLDNVNNFCIKKGDCFSGVRSFAIDPKGDIYSCVYAMGEKEHCLGNITEGIFQIKKRATKMHFDFYKEEINSECVDCSIRSFCDGFRCKAINKKTTGKSYMPLYVTCGNNKTFFKIFKEACDG